MTCALQVVLFSVGLTPADDGGIDDAMRRCEEHLNAEYSVRLDEKQRGCVRDGLESGQECDRLLNLCADVGRIECLAWIDETYEIEPLARDLGLEVSAEHDRIRACIGHDTRRMRLVDAVKYCDNVFKVHCSGLDVLAEIAEAQVSRCEKRLGESLGLKLREYKGWRTCAQHEVHDRYSMSGQSSDEEACRATFLDECGTNIDATVETGALTAEQRTFLECCSADALDPNRGDSDPCRVIDHGFERGPCHDRPVCVNRQTSEWIHCSALRTSRADLPRALHTDGLELPLDQGLNRPVVVVEPGFEHR